MAPFPSPAFRGWACIQRAFLFQAHREPGYPEEWWGQDGHNTHTLYGSQGNGAQRHLTAKSSEDNSSPSVLINSMSCLVPPDLGWLFSATWHDLLHFKVWERVARKSTVASLQRFIHLGVVLHKVTRYQCQTQGRRHCWFNHKMSWKFLKPNFTLKKS